MNKRGASKKRSSERAYSYRGKRDELYIDCGECRRNPFCRFYDPSLVECPVALCAAVPGRRTRRGTRGCIGGGVLGDDLHPRSWLEYKRDMAEAAWNRTLRRLPKELQSSARKMMQESLEALERAIVADYMHSEGVL